MSQALVLIIMGSQSDWPTMSHAVETLEALGIPYESKIVSAHRTPQRLYDFAHQAKDRGIQVIIAGAGGAAHLPGMTAAMTPLPVFGVPVESKALSGQDSLIQLFKCLQVFPSAHLLSASLGQLTPLYLLPLYCRYQMRQSPTNSMRGAKNAQIWLPSNLQTRNDKTSLPPSLWQYYRHTRNWTAWSHA